MLRDRTGDGTVTSDDVGVTVGMSEVNFSLNLGITVNFQAGVGLGIDSVPFNPIGTPQDNQGGFTVSLTYDSFNFRLNNNAPYFDLGGSRERVAIQDRRLSAGDDDRRPGLFERRRHQQQAQRRRQRMPDLSLAFTADVNASGISTPKISGSVDLNVHLKSLIVPNLPQVQADMITVVDLADRRHIAFDLVRAGLGCADLAVQRREDEHWVGVG